MKINVKLSSAGRTSVAPASRTVYCASVSASRVPDSEVRSAMIQLRHEMDEGRAMEERISSNSIEFAKSFRCL